MDTNTERNLMRLNYSSTEFSKIVQESSRPVIVPLYTTIPMPDISPCQMFAEIFGREGFLLESMKGEPREASYSFLGGKPDAIITITDTVEIEGDKDLFSKIPMKDGDPLSCLRAILSQFPSENTETRFLGGFVGYCSYDLVYYLYPQVRRERKEKGTTPVIRVMLVTEGITFDYEKNSLLIFQSPILDEGADPSAIYENAYQRIQSLYRSVCSCTTARKERREEQKKGGVPEKMVPDNVSLSREGYEKAVTIVQEYIRAGDIFQAVLSRRLTYPFSGDPLSLYGVVRKINPGPYMYYIGFPDQYIIGSSPEMLVQVLDGIVTTVPIAGTRPRGTTPAEDEELARDLLSDEKERAEHLMLVDLARNDIGRVCKFGSIYVDDFMKIEKFSHVQHIVSTVTGRLCEEFDCIDALQSCFPAGTLSGAPKVRAMQIIDDLEPVARGLYGGAVGYFGFNGNMDLAIAIRTVIAENGVMTLSTGAGIVADSVPSREFTETEQKAQVLITALQLTGGVS